MSLSLIKYIPQLTLIIKYIEPLFLLLKGRKFKDALELAGKYIREAAEQYTENEDKRRYVAAKLTVALEKWLKVDLPDSLVFMLIELAYQKYKASKDEDKPPVVVDPPKPKPEDEIYFRILAELPDESKLKSGDTVYFAPLGNTYFVIPRGIGAKPPAAYQFFKRIE